MDKKNGFFSSLQNFILILVPNKFYLFFNFIFPLSQLNFIIFLN